MAAVHALRTEQLGPEADLRAAWTHSEILRAAEACLDAVRAHIGRLFNAGLAMVHALWPNAVVPNSVTWLARWLEYGLDRFAGWRASAARAGAEMAVWFAVS